MHPTSLSRFASGLPRMVPLILASLAVLLLHHAAAPAQESAVAPEVHASASGQPAGPNEFLLTAARTDSPRHTLASFLRLGKELEAAVTAFRHTRDRVHAERIGLISDELVSLIDLSQVSVAARRETGDETLGYLLDIFGRIALPNLADVPDVSAFGAEEPANYTIPDTPLSINRIESGPREGEFLFSERTVRVAPLTCPPKTDPG